eukprot:TRINITY_DN12424_c0_g1_i3.p2 TRINITY_DN12424_c0_g1~~TRINITY_DN12424_c0_g1_i3.p2  ORF type:complete len:103 (+),score=22.78 TRINITY_DN12424_c0_g1_i3:342-650(+)
METLILGLVPDSIYKKLTKGLRIERLIESSGTFIVLYFPFLSRINEESSHNFNRVRVIKELLNLIDEDAKSMLIDPIKAVGDIYMVSLHPKDDFRFFKLSHL